MIYIYIYIYIYISLKKSVKAGVPRVPELLLSLFFFFFFFFINKGDVSQSFEDSSTRLRVKLRILDLVFSCSPPNGMILRRWALRKKNVWWAQQFWTSS
jgi:hypothetical protein